MKWRYKGGFMNSNELVALFCLHWLRKREIIKKNKQKKLDHSNRDHFFLLRLKLSFLQPTSLCLPTFSLWTAFSPSGMSSSAGSFSLWLWQYSKGGNSHRYAYVHTNRHAQMVLLPQGQSSILSTLPVPILMPARQNNLKWHGAWLCSLCPGCNLYLVSVKTDTSGS